MRASVILALALMVPGQQPALGQSPPLQTPLDAEAAAFALGKRLFASGAQPSCTVCHTLRDADSTGEVGPVLDELRPDAGRVAQALRNGVGPMPSYRGRLTDKEIEALAVYVSKAVKSPP